MIGERIATVIGLLDDGREPTPQFDAMVVGILNSFWLQYQHLRPNASGFIVPAIVDTQEHVSFWGVIDTKEIPNEDIYIEVWRRFLSALDQVGERNINGFGLVDMESVLQRKAAPSLRRM